MDISSLPSAFASRRGSQTKTASSVSLSLERPSVAPAPNVLEDYLAECKEACDGEIDRLFAPGQHGASRLYELILDYPRRGGKALPPAPSIATRLGLRGHTEAILARAWTTRSRSRSTWVMPCCRCRCNHCSTTSSASGSGRPYASCGPSRT